MAKYDMKGDWDARARDDAAFAVACENARDEATFSASGKADVQRLLDGVESKLPGRRRALEIGCGVGRLAAHLAGRFEQIYGVDVSGEMVRRAQRRLGHLPCVHFAEIDGLGELPFAESRFDFCFSYITFHHIPVKKAVVRYVAEAHRVLKAGGVFRFHLFGRGNSPWQAVRERVTKKSTWRGYKFTREEIIEAAAGAGFGAVETRYIPAPFQQRSLLVWKTMPDVIWVTARKGQ